jgi:PAS domain S-box-containing protein
MPIPSVENSQKIKRSLLIATLFWCINILLAWALIALSVHHSQVEHSALAQARSIIDHTMGLRAWAASHGGVYVPPTDTTPPNPYLAHLPERDLALADGTTLTLLNPAYLVRDLQRHFDGVFGIHTNLTSLNPIRPENGPDEWERRGLHAFAEGATEFSEFTTLAGQQTLRLMQPLITAKSCLKCHAHQGYAEGDLHGGISVRLPLGELLDVARHHKMHWGLALLGLWLLGQAGIWFAGRRIITLLRSRESAYAELAASQAELELKVLERTKALEEEVRQRAKTQEALESSHSELQQIFNSAADGFRVVAWDYTIVKFNAPFARLVEAGDQEILHRKCFDVFPGPSCHTDACPLARARHGEVINQEVRKTTRAGNTIDCLIQTAIFYDPKGTAMGILESFRDISALKEMEKDLSAEAARNARQAVDLQQKNTDILAKNIELEQALQELKAAQSQMLQNEKMATVGQLAAGVAHEINNPTGFVTSNLFSLEKYAQRLTDFLALLQEAVAPEKEQEIATARRTMKIDHISQDIHDLIRESLDGTDRIKKIVMSLKNFSRTDQEEYGPAQINDCLETTLHVVWNELKYKATVEKEYGDLPLTRCYAQQLNQVFMNLLVNAAQAIQEQGVITIRTWATTTTIFITISDSGTGMDHETMAHIFEPFFTTKNKDKGTGLGLSIAHDIITKKHLGKLQVASEPGHGTTFTIELPIVSA